jgi:hypothetical protein
MLSMALQGVRQSVLSLPASLDDKKQTPIIFQIRRWRMGECNKLCIALVSVGLLLGCGALWEGTQESNQIRCTDRDGQILYTGPYNEESLKGYLVQVDELTRAFYPKGMCHKVPA